VIAGAPESPLVELDPIPGLEPRHRVFHVFEEIYRRATGLPAPEAAPRVSPRTASGRSARAPA
jgi:hypothetical protein